MYQPIDNIRKIRQYVLGYIKDLSIEKLNKIPHGFNNNILWNVGHLIATQQSICYTKGNLSPAISPDIYQQYVPGSKPEVFFDSDEEDEVKSLLFSSLDRLQRDYDQRAFDAFIPWTNRYGFTITSIDDALAYMYFHEGLHLGVIMSLKKLVQK